MSEINLIKKLEKLNNEKPNRDWVDFTKESILSTSPTIERQGFGFWFEKEQVLNFAPLTICVLAGLIFGFFIVSIDTNNNGQVIVENTENENMVAETMQSQEIESEEEVQIIATVSEIEEIIPSIQDTEASMFSAALNEDTEEVASIESVVQERANRIKTEVIECNKKEMNGVLTEEEKDRCEDLKSQLNQFEQFLNE